jgi:hypothetical protein
MAMSVAGVSESFAITRQGLDSASTVPACSAQDSTLPWKSQWSVYLRWLLISLLPRPRGISSIAWKRFSNAAQVSDAANEQCSALTDTSARGLSLSAGANEALQGVHEMARSAKQLEMVAIDMQHRISIETL